MFKARGRIKGLRTNLAVLGISSACVLAGAYIVSYGGTRTINNPELLTLWYWPLIVISFGACGIGMYVAKGIVRPRWLRYVIGLFSLTPLVAVLAASWLYLELPLIAFTAPALVCLIYSLIFDEPPTETTTRALIRFFGSVVLIVLAPLSYIFPQHQPLPVGEVILWVLFGIGIVGAIIHLFRPNNEVDRIVGMVTGAAFLGFSIACFGHLRMVAALFYLPVGAIILSMPLLKNFRLSIADSDQGMTEENKLVREIEKPLELVAWAIFLFAYLYVFLVSDVRIYSAVTFAIFAVYYFCYAGLFRMFPPQRSTFNNLFLQSIAYVLLLSLLCHVTGGLSSPYVWFFLLAIQSATATPKPKSILGILSLIVIYFAFEIDYASNLGLLNTGLVLNGIFRPVFIIFLSGLYGYHLSSRRKQVDEELLSVSTSFKEGVLREGLAKEMAIKQASEMSLLRKRDEALLNSLADAVIALDTVGLITLVNPVAQKMFEIPMQDILGKRLRDLIILKRENDPEFRPVFVLGPLVDTALHGRASPLPDGLYLEKPDGRRVFYAGMILPVLEDAEHPSGAVVVMQDVTYARNVDQLKTNFISVAAHQLRTPLSTIRWYLELLNDPTEGKLNKDQKGYVENAYTSVLRMVGLVNSLLSITRLENARVPIRPEPVDLKAMTEAIIENEGRKLKEHELAVSLKIPDQLEKIMLDPTLSREVFVNLIENAIRYTRKGGKIEITLQDAEGMQLWSIKDEGIGIPKAQQEKIFEKFYRATNAVEFNSEGSGLGLYLARFIVESWGGKLTFESREGYGTTFRVTVPKQGMKARTGEVSIDA